MDEAEQVSRLIGDIYDAALDRSLWNDVLAKAGVFVGCCSGGLVAETAARTMPHFYFLWNVEEHYMKLYLETYSRVSPLVVPTLLYAKTGSVLASVDLVPRVEMEASRFFKEWAAPQGLIDAISATLERSSASYAVLAFHRHLTQGYVDDECRRRMRIVAPHFRRAVSISNLIDLHKVEAAALADTLDGLASAILLVDAGGYIVHANISAYAMLEERALLRDAAGKLSAVDPTADQALRDVFATAEIGDAALGTKGIAIALGETDGEGWLAHVLPLTSGMRRKAGATYSAVAAVFVRKAALDLPHPVETMANSYRLTPAEMRVLMAIVEVGGVPEVAPVLGIAETTVKTHLQRVFEKTGTKRQADLVKLVAGYMSPLST